MALTAILLAGLSLLREGPCQLDASSWLLYTDHHNGFTIQYPASAHVDTPREPVPHLVARRIIAFEEQSQTLERWRALISFQISVWEDQKNYSARDWALRTTPRQFTSDAGPSRVGDSQGYQLRSTNLFWPTRLIFVRRGIR